MPRAKNLKEAYNNFYVEPLKDDQERADFYVDRPGSISPMIDVTTPTNEFVGIYGLSTDGM